MTKENMWRTLQGVKPIMSLRCRFGWHRWTNYEVIDRSHDFMMPTARSHCADCGLPRYEQPYSKSNRKNP